MAPARPLLLRACGRSRGRSAARSLSPACRAGEADADPHQRRKRHPGTRLRQPSARAAASLTACSTAPPWTSPTPCRWTPPCCAGSHGRSSMRAATSASMPPRPSATGASARTRIGPQVLAERCAAAAIALVTFSSDQVFDGSIARPRVESDAVRPLNVYGRSKAAAEARVREAHPAALVIRTSAFFGPWDEHNFLAQALRALARGEPFTAADDVRVSPTYVPDLVGHLSRPADRRRGGALAPGQRRRRELGGVRRPGRRLRDDCRRFAAPAPRPVAGPARRPGRPTPCWAASAAG